MQERVTELTTQYPFFAKIIKWLYKPKKFKDKYRTAEWARFNPDKNIKIEQLASGAYSLCADLHRSQYSGDILSYFIVEYDPKSWRGAYNIHIYFAYCRCRQGEAVSVEDEWREYSQEDALRQIQHYCYIFMK